VIDLLRRWDVKERVSIIDLLEIGLQETASNTASEHYHSDAQEGSVFKKRYATERIRQVQRLEVLAEWVECGRPGRA